MKNHFGAASVLVLGLAVASSAADKPKEDAAVVEEGCKDGKAADCRRLGVMSYYGDGTPKDVARAVALFQQACDGGDAMGCGNLGRLYETGDGVAKDLDRAKGLYKQTCDRGELRGCAALQRLDPSEQTAAGPQAPSGTGEQSPPAQRRGRPSPVGKALDPSIDNQVRKELQRNSQLGLSTGRGQNVGGLHFDPQGADFTAWVNQFRLEVYKNWILPPSATLGLRGHVDIEFVVERNGKLSSLQIVKKSGTVSLDRAVEQAFKESHFAPLPADYRPPRITMVASFFYNEQPQD
jgi:TonB family protein